jgi:chromosome segregation ATPase
VVALQTAVNESAARSVDLEAQIAAAAVASQRATDCASEAARVDAAAAESQLLAAHAQLAQLASHAAEHAAALAAARSECDALREALAAAQSAADAAVERERLQREAQRTAETEVQTEGSAAAVDASADSVAHQAVGATTANGDEVAKLRAHIVELEASLSHVTLKAKEKIGAVKMNSIAQLQRQQEETGVLLQQSERRFQEATDLAQALQGRLDAMIAEHQQVRLHADIKATWLLTWFCCRLWFTCCSPSNRFFPVSITRSGRPRNRSKPRCAIASRSSTRSAKKWWSC